MIVNDDLVDLGQETVENLRGGCGDPGRCKRLDPRQAGPQYCQEIFKVLKRTRSTTRRASAATIPPIRCASSPRRRRYRIMGFARSIFQRPSTTIWSASTTRRDIRRPRALSLSLLRRPTRQPCPQGRLLRGGDGPARRFPHRRLRRWRGDPDDGPHLIYLPERTFAVASSHRREGDVRAIMGAASSPPPRASMMRMGKRSSPSSPGRWKRTRRRSRAALRHRARLPTFCARKSS